MRIYKVKDFVSKTFKGGLPRVAKRFGFVGDSLSRRAKWASEAGAYDALADKSLYLRPHADTGFLTDGLAFQQWDGNMNRPVLGHAETWPVAKRETNASGVTLYRK